MVNLEGGSPVRRASSKREVAAGRARHELEPIVRRVRDEFLEMPGLQLTPAQASRLWGLEHDTCCAVIDALVTAAFLRWTARGAITKAD